MKDEPPAKRRIRLGKLWWWMVAMFVGVIGWQMQELHLYNAAVREAKEAGFQWTCDNAFSLIKQDWRNAFKTETWGPHPRELDMGAIPDIGRYREILHRLRPTEMSAHGFQDENLDVLKGLTSLQVLILYKCHVLQNVDALKSLTKLKALNLSECHVLQNVDALKSLNGLQEISLSGCLMLQNIEGLKTLTGLQYLELNGCFALQNVDTIKCLTGLSYLDLSRCPALQNVDELKRLTALQNLYLSHCPVLQNVDGLKGLTKLQMLSLSFCPALLNVDGLKGLTGLQHLDIYGSHKIPAAALRELRAALPKTDITFPAPE